MAAVFHHDPVDSWIFPTPPGARARFERLMPRLFRVARGSSRLLRSEKPGGYALWVPLGMHALTTRDQVRMLPENVPINRGEDEQR